MRHSLTLISAVLVVLAQPAAAQGDFLRSVDTLGDPRGYCFDVPGFGRNLGLDGPLGTHSCKYSIPGFYVDELFVLTDQNHLRLPEYDYCVAAEALEAGAHPTTTPCDSPGMSFRLKSTTAGISPARTK